MDVHCGSHMKPANMLKYSLFCDITQRVVVIPYRRFGTTYWSYLQELKIQDFIYFAAEALNHAK
jgi:hypothetical protein